MKPDVYPGWLPFIVLFSLPVTATAEPRPEAKPAHSSKMSYLDNGMIKIGIDLNLGGSITYLSLSGKDDNLINNFDWGRQVQMSYYAGPVPFEVGAKKPMKQWRHLGWNPIQSGDDYRNPSKVLESKIDKESIYVKCIPMQWPLENEPGECTFETWIHLDGAAASVRSRLRNARSDKTQYAARMQELPAVYVNAPYHRLFSYTGDKPFAQDELRRIEYVPRAATPWTSWIATENWSAQVNERDFGLGVWHPGCYRFSGGFAGKPGAGGSSDNPTGYLAPNAVEILDHNIRHEYRYSLIVGNLRDIRRYVTDRSAKPKPPHYVFRDDRQGWHYIHAADTGWPIEKGLQVLLEKPDPQLIGPAGFWKADEAPTLRIEASYRTAEKESQIFWTTSTQLGFTGSFSMRFPVVGDGKNRVYEVKLADSPNYRGIITQLRFDPVTAGAPGDRIDVQSIGFPKP